MIKGGKSSPAIKFAEKCKSILLSNWQGNLNTIKFDNENSKKEIYSSKVKYFLRKGKPYIWVPENDVHNLNFVIDDRASFTVSSPFPGPLASLFRSIKRLPARVALTGEVVSFEDEKEKLIAESLGQSLLAEERAISESSYAVSAILRSSHRGSTSRSANLQEILQGDNHYSVYKLNPSSVTYIESSGAVHEVTLEDIEKSKPDPLSPFSMSLIDGINQSETMRRALVLFCITFLEEKTKDAFLVSVDKKGFDVLGKVLGPENDDGSRKYQWKELRCKLKEEAPDVETFCRQLLEMEEEALKIISSFSGI